MEKNVRPKYVKKRTEIDFGAFCSLMPKSQLLADLRYAFSERHHYEEMEREFKLAAIKAAKAAKELNLASPKAKKKKTGLAVDSEEEDALVLPPKHSFGFVIKPTPM